MRIFDRERHAFCFRFRSYLSSLEFQLGVNFEGVFPEKIKKRGDENQRRELKPKAPILRRYHFEQFVDDQNRAEQEEKIGHPDRFGYWLMAHPFFNFKP